MNKYQKFHQGHYGPSATFLTTVALAFTFGFVTTSLSVLLDNSPVIFLVIMLPAIFFYVKAVSQSIYNSADRHISNTYARVLVKTYAVGVVCFYGYLFFGGVFG